MEKQIAVYIWKDIERVHTERCDLIYEGSKLVGVNYDSDNIVKDLDKLIKQLQQYRSELATFYNYTPPKKESYLYTYVYLMKAGPYYKIGRSLRPQLREKTLMGLDYRVELIFMSPLTMREDEKELHNKFREKRVKGEWFDLTNEDVKYIKSFKYGI